MDLTQMHLKQVTNIIPNTLKVDQPQNARPSLINPNWVTQETPFSTEVDVNFLDSSVLIGTHRVKVNGVLYRRDLGDEISHGVEILEVNSPSIPLSKLAKERMSSLIAEIQLAVFFDDAITHY